MTLQVLSGIAAAVMTMSCGAAFAGDNKASASANATFGNRTEKPDGSVAMTVGRRLPTEWETKVGTDVTLARPASPTLSENLLTGTTPDQSSAGTVWGSVTMPGFLPLVWDKTAVEARLDSGKDEGKLGATLSRSVPLGQHFSVTLENSYSVTRQLVENAPAMSPVPLTVSPPPEIGPAAPPQVLGAGETLRFNIHPSGTTFSAGATSSTADDQWHNKLSVEQTLFGPLKVTTSVEDAGKAETNKSITAGFKKVW